MYKFSAEFETIKELADFVNGIQGGVPAAATVEQAAPTTKAKAKKEKEAPAPLTAAAPEAPFVPKAEVKASEVVVEKTPVVAQPAAQDSAIMVEEIKAIVAGLKAKGTNDDQLKAVFSGIFAQLGLPQGVPVSKLENDQITRFLMALKDHAAPKENSFI
jgi:hypothetical protein